MLVCKGYTMAKEKPLIYNEGGRVPCSACGDDLEWLTAEQKNVKKGLIRLFCRTCCLHHSGDKDDTAKWARGMANGSIPPPIPSNYAEEFADDDQQPTQPPHGLGGEEAASRERESGGEPA